MPRDNRQFEAARNGELYTLQRLVNVNNRVNETDNSGNTALHHAVLGGHVDCARVLLERGADKGIENGTHQKPVDLCNDTNRRQFLDLFSNYATLTDQTNSSRGSGSTTFSAETPSVCSSSNSSEEYNSPPGDASPGAYLNISERFVLGSAREMLSGHRR